LYRNIVFFDIRFFDILDQPTESRPGARAVWVDQSDYKAVGAALAATRRRAGLSQQELAKRLFKPQSFVSNYERGQRRIDVLELLRIVEVLGANPRKVFGDILVRLSKRAKRI
jgi:Helix-turn-helix